MQKNRIAIIGCGAVAELFHLPALSELKQVKPVLVVDTNLERAKQLASKFNVPNITNDFHRVPDYADAAILAVPPNLHAPMAIYLLSKGIHVLVEKPMAMTTSECDAMIKMARQHNCILAVGLVHRFYPSSLFVKDFVSEGCLGSIHRFEFREGITYMWPITTDFFLRKKMGGGVLLDVSVHVLDMLLFCLGDWKDVKYFDNASGGVESDCEIHLTLKSGVKGVVELSNTRNLRNTFQIYGEKGKIEVGFLSKEVILHTGEGKTHLNGHCFYPEKSGHAQQDILKLQLENFAQAFQENCPPFVSGTEGRRAIRLIEACYANRDRLRQPWLEYENKQNLMIK